MLSTSRISLNHEILPVTFRALHSITRAQAAAAVQALAARDDLWNVDQHEDYEGYLSLVITHEVSSTTFIISGTVDRIEVAELREDDLKLLGAFQTISNAVLEIRR